MQSEDRSVLFRVKLLLAVLLLALAATRGSDAAWPLVLWPMYARVHPPPPQQAEEVELRVRTGGDGERVLLPAALFTHVHAALGRAVVEGAFTDGPERERYRAVLLAQLSRSFGTVAGLEVRARRVGWDVESRQTPPFRSCCADRSEDLGTLRVDPQP